MNRTGTYQLDADQSALWEDDGPAGADFRTEYRQDSYIYDVGRHVEVYAHNGSLLDAWDVEEADPPDHYRNPTEDRMDREQDHE